MPRLQFQPAAHYPFATDMPIQPGQINEGGHLDNVQLLGLVSEARTRFFGWLGYSVMDVAGHAFFVADQAVQYRSEGQPGEVLRIEMTPADLNPKGFDLLFRVSESQSGREVALGKIGLVCVDLASRKPGPMPEAFRQALACAG
ncbi:acyl-CoA thioesterase [Malikia granosa]|uniref:Thioesterase n=1 Tax=Malikia granosa TaxID=263067 RepID=A0A2S9K857_9BURK|nr:thioesterase family protein [Malikia granosa]PRD66649.1 thioesterase [Malikia granosa]